MILKLLIQSNLIMNKMNYNKINFKINKYQFIRKLNKIKRQKLIRYMITFIKNIFLKRMNNNNYNKRNKMTKIYNKIIQMNKKKLM